MMLFSFYSGSNPFSRPTCLKSTTTINPMNAATLTPHKPVRTMGTTLAVIPVLALLCWVSMILAILIFPSFFLSTEDEPLPADLATEIPDAASLFFPEGVTAETTVRELMEKDSAFFESHSGTNRWIFIGVTIFFAAVSLVILRMALSWRREDPFGRGTVLGLRWLGFLFLTQFVVSLFFTFLVPSSGYITLLQYSQRFDDLVLASESGASLSCGIVFLTLSWVVEYGRKMKEEQALTI